MRRLALLALTSAAAAAAQPVAYETVATAQRAEEIPLRAERRVAQGREILRQHLAEVGGAYLRLPPGGGEGVPRPPSHGQVAAQPHPLASRRAGRAWLRHVGWLYCGARIKMFSGQIASCFRDSDG